MDLAFGAQIPVDGKPLAGVVVNIGQGNYLAARVADGPLAPVARPRAVLADGVLSALLALADLAVAVIVISAAVEASVGALDSPGAHGLFGRL